MQANVKCTPSTPAPARKRRRPNQDLQQRLARCEELLSEYAAKKPEEPSSEGEDTRQPWRPTGQLIIDDGGGVKFMDSYLCATIHDEVSVALLTETPRPWLESAGRPRVAQQLLTSCKAPRNERDIGR